MPFINFKLKHPDDVMPWGTVPDARMHWFGLTDSEYWIDVGKATIYEYTADALKHWDRNDIRHVDYHLVRLIEDLTGLFPAIAEPVPDQLYAMAKDHKHLYDFYEKALNWLDQLSDDPAIDEDVYFDKYHKITEWVNNRTLSSMHLNSGPDVSFFSNKEDVSIVWNAKSLIEEKIPVWTAGIGEVTIKYELFVDEIEDFGKRFFIAMDVQVQMAVQKDWGTIDLNKERLIEEHKERKADFQKSLLVLKERQAEQTDWSLITSLINEMNA